MTVKFSKFRCKKHEFGFPTSNEDWEFHKDVWILHFWGNPREVAIKKAQKVKEWNEIGQPVTAWYNPLQLPKSFGI